MNQQLFTRCGARLLVAALALLLGHAALGHHSQSEFDFRKRVEVTGKVTKLDWRSPHARLYIDVVDAEGKTASWDFELPSPTTLMRRGWSRKSLQVGDQVSVKGVEARNHPFIAYANSITTADGKALFTGTTDVYEPEKEAAPEAGK